LFPDGEAEAEVVSHRHVRIERVVLEDHRDVALLGRKVRDVALANPNDAIAHSLEPGHQP